MMILTPLNLEVRYNMNFEKNYNNLLKQMNVNPEKKSLKNNIDKNTPLFPFKSRTEDTATFENGFYSVLGEFSRILLNKKLDDSLNIKDIIAESKNNENFDIETESEDYLEKLVKEYLFNEKDELKIINPYLFLYLPLSNNKKSKGEKSIALFLRDVFFRDNKNLINFFNNKETNNLLIKLVLKNIPELTDNKTDFKYDCMIDSISELFNDDIDYLCKHEQYFIKNIDKVFAYYYFFYISQLVLKINRGFNDNKEIDELYYLLDWESASKNRKAVKKGYRFLTDKTASLFTKVSLIDQMNTLLGTHDLLEKDMLIYYEKLNYTEQREFLKYLKKWICVYKYYNDFDLTKNSEEEYLYDLSDNFKDLMNELFVTLNDKEHGNNPEPKSRYAINLKNIAKKYFIKRRGSYGYTLNMNREILIVLTALCVKDKKIRLTQLFDEYEKRGIYFDIQSKEEIIKLLTQLNLIDKKSDSGDAQYVKPIL